MSNSGLQKAVGSRLESHPNFSNASFITYQVLQQLQHSSPWSKPQIFIIPPWISIEQHGKCCQNSRLKHIQKHVVHHSVSKGHGAHHS